MNRQQRRAAQKAAPKKPAWRKLTPDERKAELIKNGITSSDLQKAYEDGFEKGYRESAFPLVKTLYACVCLTCHDLYGFGARRCIRLLKALDANIANQLTSIEAVDEVFEKLHLKLNFDEPFDRLEETNED